MAEKYLWESIPEEMEKHILEHLRTAPKLDILRHLIGVGYLLSDIGAQFLEEALQEIEDENLRKMLSQLVENEKQREAMYTSKLEDALGWVEDLVWQNCCDKNGWCDSMANGFWAATMEDLACYGRFKITDKYGRIVKGYFPHRKIPEEVQSESTD